MEESDLNGGDLGGNGPGSGWSAENWVFRVKKTGQGGCIGSGHLARYGVRCPNPWPTQGSPLLATPG